MGKISTRAALGTVLAAVVLMAGCGSGASDAPTKSSFIKEGNAICHGWQVARAERFGQLNTRLTPTTTNAERAKVFVWLFRPYGTAIEKLSELSVPRGDEKKVKAVLEAMEDGLGRIKANPIAAVNSVNTFRRPNKLAEGYGLKECIV